MSMRWTPLPGEVNELPTRCPRCGTEFVCACGKPCMIVIRCGEDSCRPASDPPLICLQCFEKRACKDER